MPSAISARVNQKRTGPRRRGSRGATGRAGGAAYVGGSGVRRAVRRTSGVGVDRAPAYGRREPRGRRSVAVLAGHEEQHDHGDDRQRPGEPEDPPRVADQGERREHADDEQRHGAAALVEGDGGLAGLLVGHQQPAGAVDDQAGAAEEGEDDEGDPQHERVDVEVAGQAAGDAGDLAVGGGAAEPAEVADLVAGDARALLGRRAGGVLRVVWWSCLKPAVSGSSPPSGTTLILPLRPRPRVRGGPGLLLMVRACRLCDD